LSVIWSLLSIGGDYNFISYLLGVSSAIFSTLSLISFFLLKLLDFEITEFTAFLACKEKEDAEKKELQDKRNKSIELLTKDDEFSDAEKLHFSQVRSADSSGGEIDKVVAEIEVVKRQFSDDFESLKIVLEEVKKGVEALQSNNRMLERPVLFPTPIDYMNQYILGFAEARSAGSRFEKGIITPPYVKGRSRLVSEMFGSQFLKLERIAEDASRILPFSKPL
jgi:hypothetical protein